MTGSILGTSTHLIMHRLVRSKGTWHVWHTMESCMHSGTIRLDWSPLQSVWYQPAALLAAMPK
jgi:hypothetical protein